MGKKFSELERAVSLNNGDLAAFAQVDQSAPTGYKSKAAPMSLVSQKILKDTEYASDLQTDDKTVLGAITEVNSRTISYDAVSRSIAHFKTSLELPIKSLGIDVNAVQASGTPTPAAPLPISGWSEISTLHCGVNIWDEETLVGGYNISDGAFNPNLTGRLCSKNMIKVQPNSTVYWHSLANSSTGNIFFYDANKQYVNGYTGMGNSVINIPNNSHYMNFTLPTAYGTTYNNNVSVNNPSSDAEYHAYNGTIEVISLGSSYYGGKFTQDKDGHRQFVVTHAILEKAVADMNNSDDYPGWKNSGARNIVGAEVSSYFTGILNVGNGYSINTRGSNDIVYLPTGTYSMTQSQWISNYPDLIVQLLLPYAEPIVVALSDGEPIVAFQGINNICVDSGDASIEYALTIEEYIDKKIASVQALILNS